MLYFYLTHLFYIYYRVLSFCFCLTAEAFMQKNISIVGDMTMKIKSIGFTRSSKWKWICSVNSL